jgi:hypothetical protein
MTLPIQADARPLETFWVSRDEGRTRTGLAALSAGGTRQLIDA